MASDRSDSVAVTDGACNAGGRTVASTVTPTSVDPPQPRTKKGRYAAPNDPGADKPRTRIFSKPKLPEEQCKAELRVKINSVEAGMLERIQGHMDFPLSVIVRLWIREKYEEIYGDASPTEKTLDEIGQAVR
jgi:hypothetical protein